MNRFSIALTAALLLAGGLAVAQEEEYLLVYRLILDADTTATTVPNQALSRYVEAQSALQRLQKLYPDWNEPLIRFRLDYLATKVAENSGGAAVPKPAPPASDSTSKTGEAAATGSGGANEQLLALQKQVQQLQGEVLVLQAKLREAFSAQPAMADPREFAKAQERIVALEKENSLLKVALEQQTRGGATNQLARARRELAEVNRRMAEQTERAYVLALEKEALQLKLNEALRALSNATTPNATPKKANPDQP